MAKFKTFDEAQKDARKKALEAMEKCCVVGEASTKVDCPVLSGTLRRSYTHKVEETEDGVVGAVGSNVEYAPFADRKKPHLSKSLHSNMETFKKIIQDTLKL